MTVRMRSGKEEGVEGTERMEDFGKGSRKVCSGNTTNAESSEGGDLGGISARGASEGEREEFSGLRAGLSPKKGYKAGKKTERSKTSRHRKNRKNRHQER